MSTEAWVLSAAELVAPATLGWLIARSVAAPRAAWSRALVILGALGLATVVDALTHALSLWDALTLATSWAVGVILAGLDRRRVAPWAVSGLVFLALAHGVGQVALPPAPQFQDEAPATIRYQTTDRYGEVACGLAAPGYDEGGAWGRALRQRTITEPTTVHLGDSMLVFTTPSADGHMTDEASRFPERLDAADPDGAHVNLGTPGVSVDAMLGIAREAMRRLPVQRIVVHLLMSNDLSELGRELACCPGGGPLDLSNPQLPPRCPNPRPTLSAWPALSELVLRSRPPLWLRLATAESHVVGHLRLRLANLLGSGTPWGGWLDTDDLRWPDDHPVVVDGLARMAQVLAVLQAETAARGVDLVVVGMPIGPFLDPAEPKAELARRRVETLAALCARQQIRFLDAWPAFTPPQATWFLADRYHFSADGHAHMARWLESALDE